MKCVRKFFRKRFRYEAANWPTWRDVIAQEKEDEMLAETSDQGGKRLRLDLEVEASGFGGAMQRELEDVRGNHW